MLSQGPYTLTLGQTTELAQPSTSARFVAAVLSNTSPYDCAVDINGPQQWLKAWSSDLYLIDPGANILVTPEYSTASAAGNVLTVTWYGPTDKVTGTYPVSLTAQAVAATIAGTLAVVQEGRSLGQITPTGSSFIVGGLELGDQAVVLSAPYGTPTDWLTIAAYGNQSGLLAANDAITPSHPAIIPVLGGLDTSITVQWGDGPGIYGPPTLSAFALPSVPPTPKLQSITVSASQDTTGSAFTGYMLLGGKTNLIRVRQYALGGNIAPTGGYAGLLMASTTPVLGQLGAQLALQPGNANQDIIDVSDDDLVLLGFPSGTSNPAIEYQISATTGGIWCRVTYEQWA